MCRILQRGQSKRSGGAVLCVGHMHAQVDVACLAVSCHSVHMCGQRGVVRHASYKMALFNTTQERRPAWHNVCSPYSADSLGFGAQQLRPLQGLGHGTLFFCSNSCHVAARVHHWAPRPHGNCIVCMMNGQMCGWCGQMCAGQMNSDHDGPPTMLPDRLGDSCCTCRQLPLDRLAPGFLLPSIMLHSLHKSSKLWVSYLHCHVRPCVLWRAHTNERVHARGSIEMSSNSPCSHSET